MLVDDMHLQCINLLHLKLKGQSNHEYNIGPNSFLGYSLLKPKFPPLPTFIQEIYCYLNHILTDTN